jgi:hypothetical protein
MSPGQKAAPTAEDGDDANLHDLFVEQLWKVREVHQRGAGRDKSRQCLPVLRLQGLDLGVVPAQQLVGEDAPKGGIPGDGTHERE